jgi:hypothetical protein
LLGKKLLLGTQTPFFLNRNGCLYITGLDCEALDTKPEINVLCAVILKFKENLDLVASLIENCDMILSAQFHLIASYAPLVIAFLLGRKAWPKMF